MKHEGRSAISIVTELLFIFLPLLLVIMHSFSREGQPPILNRSEWSFAAIVLFGQSIVRLTAGLIKSPRRKRYQFISLIIALLITFGIVPSAFTLSWILDGNTRLWIIVVQQVLFWLSISTYIVFGTIGQMYLEENDQQSSVPA